MKRSLPLLALAVAALVAPAAAFAAPTAAPSRFFEIRALVLGDTRIEVRGKLWLDATNVGGSVGCNSIGARATVDGNVVTIVGPATMTEMACPGSDGDAEAMFLRILELGRFTIADGRWVADGGAIEVVEAPAPDPNPVPPDQPISNDPGTVCATIIDPGHTNAVDDQAPPNPGSGAGGGAGGGSGSSAGSSPGSAGGSEPSGTASSGGGAIEPVPPAPEATPPITEPAGPQPTCELIKGGGVMIDPAPGGPALPTSGEAALDARRDAGLGPLPIGLGLLILLAAVFVRRERPTPQ